MKIALPVYKDESKSSICESFGRCSHFIILDLDTNQKKELQNDASQATGGAGIKASQILLNENVEVLLTPRCGDNAYQVLKSGNVKIYKTISSCIDENIEAFRNNKLSLLENFHKGFHGRN